MTYQHPNADGNLTGVQNALRYDTDGEPALRVSIENVESNSGMSTQFGIPKYDYIENTYDVSSNLIQTVYKTGGAAGTILATVVMTYDGSNNLLTVARTV
jgi:hypothetical protein